MAPSKGENTFSFIADCVCLLAILWFINIQHATFKFTPTSEVTPYLKTLVFICMLGMMGNRTLAACNRYLCTSHWCAHLEGISSLLYLLSRVMMLLFYVYKAKASQELAPTFEYKYFGSIFPGIIWCIAMIASILLCWLWISNASDGYECESQSNDMFSFKACASSNDSNRNSGSSYMLLIIALLVEIGMTSFFLFLFLKPLHAIWNRLGQRQQQIKRMIQLNAMYVFIGMLSSNVAELYFCTGFGTSHIFRFDALINVVTMYLMATRKRPKTAPLEVKVQTVDESDSGTKIRWVNGKRVDVTHKDPAKEEREIHPSPSPFTMESD